MGNSNLPSLPSLLMADFNYDLPNENIAFEPSQIRSDSKLLVYSFENETILDDTFNQIGKHLPSNSLLVFNDSKVIAARLHFFSDSNQKIEVFLLNPVSIDWTNWECIVGNRRKFHESDELRLDTIYKGSAVSIKASWLNRDSNIIKFEVTNGLTMLDAIDIFGKVPLPPYIKRETTEDDKIRYQTVFASNPGAVAAPTASLHFTNELIEQLNLLGLRSTHFTLHVGAGTFKPVTALTSDLHDIHSERFEINATAVKDIIQHMGRVIASGTTSLRLLESLYYIGSKIALNYPYPFIVLPNDGYDPALNKLSVDQALITLYDYLADSDMNAKGETAIYIMPGFKFKIANGLITNFHQPGSTLLLLVSAFIGENWKSIYNHALASNYRFLSFGDATLLLKC